MNSNSWDVVIVGGGFAGLSAAIYLGRALRHSVVIDSGQSLGVWEPDVQNYLGFPQGVSGGELLSRGHQQAERYQNDFIADEIESAERDGDHFLLRGKAGLYRGRRVLLATGLLHLPPEMPNVKPCVGHSIFFCKDCDGYRVQGKRVGIIGYNNDAVEYALGILPYSPFVFIATNGQPPLWDPQHQQWVEEYEIPFSTQKIVDTVVEGCQLKTLFFQDGSQVDLECVFTTRGDIFHNQIARSLQAELDEEGQVLVDHKNRTSVPGLYAAGCVTPSNCQMIIAAGEGAVAAQAINRDFFEKDLLTHASRRFRTAQLNHVDAVGVVTPS